MLLCAGPLAACGSSLGAAQTGVPPAAGGNLADCWRPIHENPTVAGAFIWGWRDKALLCYDEEGKVYWAYGLAGGASTA